MPLSLQSQFLHERSILSVVNNNNFYTKRSIYLCYQFNQVLTIYAKISLNRNINFLTKFKQKNNLTEKTKLKTLNNLKSEDKRKKRSYWDSFYVFVFWTVNVDFYSLNSIKIKRTNNQDLCLWMVVEMEDKIMGYLAFDIRYTLKS